jgi:phenylalanyl-tRNA synthetase beta subunit
MKDLWEHKTQYQRKEEHTAEDFTVEQEYGIWKKSRVSVGYFVIKGDVRNFSYAFSLAKREDFEGFQ